MRNWKTKLFLSHKSRNVKSNLVDIKRGICQGGSLSPLPFCIALTSLTTENRAGYGYKIGEKSISHLFYLDNLKLVAKDHPELEELPQTLKKLNHDIGIAKFGLEKYDKATFLKTKT